MWRDTMNEKEFKEFREAVIELAAVVRRRSNLKDVDEQTFIRSIYRKLHMSWN